MKTIEQKTVVLEDSTTRDHRLGKRVITRYSKSGVVYDKQVSTYLHTKEQQERLLQACPGIKDTPLEAFICYRFAYMMRWKGGCGL